MANLVLPTLPKSVFNPALHRAILNFWFRGVPDNVTTPSMEIGSRWFGIGKPEEKAAFDSECRALAGPALDLLGPDKFPLPAWKGYKEDRALALGLSKPLRQVIHDDGVGELARADVARSMVLLLDQMPRNIFRDVQTQGVVYTHYDRLARALLHAILQPPGSATEYDCAGLDTANFKTSPVRRCWFYMPFMHSESLDEHDEYSRNLARLRADCHGDAAAVDWADMTLKVENEHRALITEYGRYPYRNEAVGRESTPAEKEYIARGGGAGNFAASVDKDQKAS